MTTSGSVITKPPSRPVSFIEPIVEEEEEEEFMTTAANASSSSQQRTVMPLSPVNAQLANHYAYTVNTTNGLSRPLSNTSMVSPISPQHGGNVFRGTGQEDTKSHHHHHHHHHVVVTGASPITMNHHHHHHHRGSSGDSTMAGGLPQPPHQQPTPPSSSASSALMGYPLAPSISATIAAVASGMSLSSPDVNGSPTSQQVSTSTSSTTTTTTTAATTTASSISSMGSTLPASFFQPATKPMTMGHMTFGNSNSNNNNNNNASANRSIGFGRGIGGATGSSFGSAGLRGFGSSFSGLSSLGINGNSNNNQQHQHQHQPATTNASMMARSSPNVTKPSHFETPQIPRELSAAASQYFSGSGPGNGANSGFSFLNHINTGNHNSHTTPDSSKNTFNAIRAPQSMNGLSSGGAISTANTSLSAQHKEAKLKSTSPKGVKSTGSHDTALAVATDHHQHHHHDHNKLSNGMMSTNATATAPAPSQPTTLLSKISNGTATTNNINNNGNGTTIISNGSPIPSADPTKDNWSSTAGHLSTSGNQLQSALPSVIPQGFTATTANTTTTTNHSRTANSHSSNGNGVMSSDALVTPQTPVSPNWTRPSCKLTDFNLLDTLGTGTFGRVFLARSRDTNQIQLFDNQQYFAMKVLKKVEVVRLKQVEHINSEKDILSSVRHPFIVNLFATFQDSTNLYMLMEYVIGGELFSHLRRAGRFTNEMTKFYAAEIVLAIEYLHSQDIIYRDLKPENLLLDHRGHVKITDFGFAKKVDERTWTLCGTPEYLAPEIIQSKGHGKPVDWWALGILIFEMLAGYPPFFDDNPFGIYEKILAGRIQFPAHFDLSAKDIVKRLLTADRTKRLGNLRGGAEDIRKHKWFRDVDWEALLNREIQAPIVPNSRHPGDTSNFEKYPEPPYQTPDPHAPDPFRHLFRDF